MSTLVYYTMLDQHTARCTATKCDAELTEDQRTMTMEMDGGTRHAYECTCGAVTITVSRQA